MGHLAQPSSPGSPVGILEHSSGARSRLHVREATLLHAPPTWRGPDMRNTTFSKEALQSFAWPSHGGNVGPCKDGNVCRALRALGNSGTKRVSALPQKGR